MDGVPGPVIEASEGDTVVVHVINDSPYDVTIHWYARTKLNSQPWPGHEPTISTETIAPPPE